MLFTTALSIRTLIVEPDWILPLTVRVLSPEASKMTFARFTYFLVPFFLIWTIASPSAKSSDRFNTIREVVVPFFTWIEFFLSANEASSAASFSVALLADWPASSA